jgi:hypothetical protein
VSHFVGDDGFDSVRHGRNAHRKRSH